MSVETFLVAYLKKVRYEELPKDAVEVAKRATLDTLATVTAGSTANGVKQLVDVVKRWGGREECTIPIYGGKVPAPHAALVMATMARARDLDDVHEEAGIHPDATIVPSALVISEYSKMFKKRVISGRDFILARTIGADFLCRLRLAGGKMARDHLISETLTPIAVAATGAKMLDFSEAKFLNAMGIAYALCSGNPQAHIEGALTVRLQQGFGAQGGMLGIFLADEGLSGAKNMLEGKCGFYSIYLGGEYIPEALTSGLGKQFKGSNISIKCYPCCMFTHGAIYAALHLASRHKIEVGNVKEVTISTCSKGYNLAGYGERKVVPRTVPDAQFSYYYTVATALVKGKVSIEDFAEEAIKNARVLAMARKIRVTIDPEKDKLPLLIAPVDVKIETNDGKHYAKTVQYVRGHPKDPMTLAEVAHKFKDCARFSANRLPHQNIDKLCKMVENLEDLEDVSTILECLV